ncbi:hypothetical protein [Stenomitos frigidus]|uniref:Uncharacterized protein n=1 Tax=Stenomitos frigidus ULC18 TaxID=2107698 RepID=A0A2T1EHW7_9CYAN|nr:hypothetical protein [Stenomitos frigidus]PSB32329.1 hypothetical protein C7B82_05845 [Stenomitos frigidus ULC18]
MSNALDTGFSWADFAAAAQAAVPPAPDLAAQPDTVALRERLLKLSSGDETPFARELALLSLARETGYPYRDLNSLAKSLEQELDWQFDQTVADHKLKTLLQSRRTHLDLTQLGLTH